MNVGVVVDDVDDVDAGVDGMDSSCLIFIRARTFSSY